LRVLAALFVSDKARYRLMEAAKLHISDRDHFRELADMYTDKNFQKNSGYRQTGSVSDYLACPDF
jgi:hypothetical protein